METLYVALWEAEKPIGFKSYYVVWKQKFSFGHLNILLRLNRTMQYGNKDVIVIGDFGAIV